MEIAFFFAFRLVPEVGLDHKSALLASQAPRPPSACRKAASALAFGTG
jgi:hypothetical protein